MKNYKIKNFGQIFTSFNMASFMLLLLKNKGSILEPSCGKGVFTNLIKKITNNYIGIEKDTDIYNSLEDKENILNIDFFDFSEDNKFDSILGNPPYVSGKNILIDTKSKLLKYNLQEKTNLYIYFIFKCIKHLNENGELIFIVPRDFINQTTAIKLNTYLYENGYFTHFFDYGDEKIFNGVSLNICVFRYEKNNLKKQENILVETKNGMQKMFFNNGMFNFSERKTVKNNNDYFMVKVGAVSGMDAIYKDEVFGDTDFVCSSTFDTGKTCKYIYKDIKNNKKILENKEILIKRKIKKFNDNNWFEWGRDVNFFVGKKRIYVNSKTRKINPFFINDCDYYDGSIIAIYPLFDCKIEDLKNKLNDIDWKEYGFISGGRFIFNVGSFLRISIPEKKLGIIN